LAQKRAVCGSQNSSSTPPFDGRLERLPMSYRLMPMLALCLPLAAHAQLIPAISYFSRLPAAPVGQPCPDASAPRAAFNAQLREVTEALTAQIASRDRVLKDVRSRDLKTLQQAQLGTPGEGGVDGETMKKMSRAERQKMAQQMMEQRYGVTPEEIKKLKQMQRSGNTAGVTGWGQAMADEQQAAAAVDPAKAAQQQKNLMETARLAARQSELVQAVAAAQNKPETQLRELEQDPVGKERLAALALHRQQAEKRTACEAKASAMRSLYAEESAYCAAMAPRHVAILEGWRAAFVAHQGDYDEIDRIQGEIQQLQHGIQPAPEQQGLSALKAVRDYATRLTEAYRFNLHGDPPDFNLYCAGAR
jgi:hypothetical protein